MERFHCICQHVCDITISSLQVCPCSSKRIPKKSGIPETTFIVVVKISKPMLFYDYEMFYHFYIMINFYIYF